MLAGVILGLVVMGQTKVAPKAEARPDPIVADLAKAIIPQGQIVQLIIEKFHILWAPKIKGKK